MELKELTKRIKNFQEIRFKSYNSNLTSELIFIHLTEEIGEIARQIFNKNSNMRNYDETNLKEEIAQSVLDLMVLAELNDMDLEKEIELKIKSMEDKWN